MPILFLESIPYHKYFHPGTTVDAGATISAITHIFNTTQVTLKGLVFTYQIPSDIMVYNLMAKINNVAYTNICLESDSLYEVYASYFPQRWIFKEPFHFLNIVTWHQAKEKSASAPQIAEPAKTHEILANMERSFLDASRFKAIGYGESEPITSNETEEGRAANWRVEVVIHPQTASGYF